MVPVSTESKELSTRKKSSQFLCYFWNWRQSHFQNSPKPKVGNEAQLLSTKKDSSFCTQPWHIQVILILYHFAFQHLHLAPTVELLLGRRPSWFLMVLYSSQINIHIQDQPQKKKELSNMKLEWLKKNKNAYESTMTLSVFLRELHYAQEKNLLTRP